MASNPKPSVDVLSYCMYQKSRAVYLFSFSFPQTIYMTIQVRSSRMENISNTVGKKSEQERETRKINERKD
jgi:hypothetical protein